MDINSLTGNTGPSQEDIQKIMNDPNTLTIECHTVFGPNTTLVVDDKVITMSSLHLGYSGRPAKTLGIDPESSTMKYCEVIEIPQEMYLEKTTTIAFGPGFYVECAPGAIVLAGGDAGYKSIDDLKVGDTLLVTKYNRETRTDFIEDIPITRIDKTSDILLSSSGIKKPMYGLICQFHNVFLAFEQEGTPLIWYINFRQ